MRVGKWGVGGGAAIHKIWASKIKTSIVNSICETKMLWAHQTSQSCRNESIDSSRRSYVIRPETETRWNICGPCICPSAKYQSWSNSVFSSITVLWYFVLCFSLMPRYSNSYPWPQFRSYKTWTPWIYSDEKWNERLNGMKHEWDQMLKEVWGEITRGKTPLELLVVDWKSAPLGQGRKLGGSVSVCTLKILQQVKIAKSRPYRPLPWQN